MARATRHITPIEMGLDASVVDLTALAGVDYSPSQGFLDVRQYFIFTAVVNVVSTTATVGSFLLRLDVLEKDKSTVLWTQDIVTGISSSTAGRHVLLFGAGATSKLVSASGALDTDSEIFKQAEYINLSIEVAVQGDGDAAANMHLLMEG